MSKRQNLKLKIKGEGVGLGIDRREKFLMQISRVKFLAPTSNSFLGWEKWEVERLDKFHRV